MFVVPPNICPHAMVNYRGEQLQVTTFTLHVGWVGVLSVNKMCQKGMINSFDLFLLWTAMPSHRHVSIPNGWVTSSSSSPTHLTSHDESQSVRRRRWNEEWNFDQNMCNSWMEIEWHRGLSRNLLELYEMEDNPILPPLSPQMRDGWGREGWSSIKHRGGNRGAA